MKSGRNYMAKKLFGKRTPATLQKEKKKAYMRDIGGGVKSWGKAGCKESQQGHWGLTGRKGKRRRTRQNRKQRVLSFLEGGNEKSKRSEPGLRHKNGQTKKNKKRCAKKTNADEQSDFTAFETAERVLWVCQHARKGKKTRTGEERKDR